MSNTDMEKEMVKARFSIGDYLCNESPYNGEKLLKIVEQTEHGFIVKRVGDDAPWMEISWNSLSGANEDGGETNWVRIPSAAIN